MQTERVRKAKNSSFKRHVRTLEEDKIFAIYSAIDGLY